MFYHLAGKLTEIDGNIAVIECAGIGFAVNITAYTAGFLKIGENEKLYISEIVKEDSFDLYGFSTKQEQRLFDLLLSVSGIGPKAANSILSVNSPDSLILAISANDEKALTSVPGIGKKTAQRVILELHDKIIKDAGSSISFAGNTSSNTPASLSSSSALNDAVAALAVLGYSNSDYTSVLKGLDVGSMTTEQIIKAVLKHM